MNQLRCPDGRHMYSLHSPAVIRFSVSYAAPVTSISRIQKTSDSFVILIYIYRFVKIYFPFLCQNGPYRATNDHVSAHIKRAAEQSAALGVILFSG